MSCVNTAPLGKRKKKRTKGKKKEVCALAATVAKNTLPTSSARLPFSRWSMWFFLEFSMLFFFHLIVPHSFHLMSMGTDWELLLTCWYQKIFNYWKSTQRAQITSWRTVFMFWLTSKSHMFCPTIEVFHKKKVLMIFLALKDSHTCQTTSSSLSLNSMRNETCSPQN